MFDADARSMAAALYDGGWRPEDRDEMIEEYDLAEDTADIIVSIMKEFQ